MRGGSNIRGAGRGEKGIGTTEAKEEKHNQEKEKAELKVNIKRGNACNCNVSECEGGEVKLIEK